MEKSVEMYYKSQNLKKWVDLLLIDGAYGYHRPKIHMIPALIFDPGFQKARVKEKKIGCSKHG